MTPSKLTRVGYNRLRVCESEHSISRYSHRTLTGFLTGFLTSFLLEVAPALFNACNKKGNRDIARRVDAQNRFTYLWWMSRVSKSADRATHNRCLSVGSRSPTSREGENLLTCYKPCGTLFSTHLAPCEGMPGLLLAPARARASPQWHRY